MRNQGQQKIGASAEQIRSEQQDALKRSRASARQLARPVNLVTNLVMAVWTILKAVVRP
jgi:hypothetical protein